MASLFKRNNRIYYVATCRRGRRIWRSLATKDEAQAKMLFADIQLLEKKPTQQTLMDFWSMVKPMMEKELSENSIRFYQYVVHKLVGIIGNKRLKGYSTFDFERYKIARLEAIKKITANKELRHLRALFERAVRFGYLESNPARRCNIFKIDQCEPQILTQADDDLTVEFKKYIEEVVEEGGI